MDCPAAAVVLLACAALAAASCSSPPCHLCNTSNICAFCRAPYTPASNCLSESSAYITGKIADNYISSSAWNASKATVLAGADASSQYFVGAFLTVPKLHTWYVDEVVFYVTSSPSVCSLQLRRCGNGTASCNASSSTYATVSSAYVSSPDAQFVLGTSTVYELHLAGPNTLSTPVVLTAGTYAALFSCPTGNVSSLCIAADDGAIQLVTDLTSSATTSSAACSVPFVVLGSDVCSPKSCSTLRSETGLQCGLMNNGCGYTQCNCTASGYSCANSSGLCSCSPQITCSAIGRSCGTILNDCGSSENCGTCNSSQSCNATSGQCTIGTHCAIKCELLCGEQEDKCGNKVDCGKCSAKNGTALFMIPTTIGVGLGAIIAIALVIRAIVRSRKISGYSTTNDDLTT